MQSTTRFELQGVYDSRIKETRTLSVWKRNSDKYSCRFKARLISGCSFALWAVLPRSKFPFGIKNTEVLLLCNNMHVPIAWHGKKYKGNYKNENGHFCVKENGHFCEQTNSETQLFLENLTIKPKNNGKRCGIIPINKSSHLNMLKTIFDVHW